MNNDSYKKFKDCLPKKPYCANDLSMGLKIRSIAHAIQHAHIQPDQPHSQIWLRFDVDRPTCPDELTDDLLLPPPNLFIQNPENCHAHYLYGLKIPIHKYHGASHKAIRYAASIDIALAKKMDADMRYTGLICKNPFYDVHRGYSPTSHEYYLEELADYVDLEPYRDGRKRLPSYGLGRNCNTFDRLRNWAYKKVGEYSSYDIWEREVIAQAFEYNLWNTPPLEYSEVRAISKSVSKWVFQHLRGKFVPFAQYVKETHTPEIQRVRGIKGGKISKGGIRTVKSIERRDIAFQLLGQGLSKTDIAKKLGISRMQVHRLLVLEV